jgi:uncharacterized protein (TIGR02186 family)
MKKIFAIAMVSLVCLSARLFAADAAIDLGVTLQPEHIRMGAGYDGENVFVSGQIPSDATALIRVTGKPEHSKLKQKGRALGVLWMNLGSVEISKVPSVFLLYLPESAPKASQTGQPAWRALDLGLEGLRKQADIVAADAEKNSLFDEFVKLKQKSGLYGQVDNAVHYGPIDGKMKPFEATLALPAALPTGTYHIDVLAVKDGAIEASAVRDIDAREVGMPAWISTLAFDHGTIYGIFAVLVAVVAGLFTGLLFKGDKGAH